MILLIAGGGSGQKPTSSTTSTTLPAAHTPLAAAWRGSGHPVTLAFGGDVHFEGVLAQRLAADPATALGQGTAATLMQGAQISMANFDSALTDGTCPAPQPKQYVWFAGSPAITAFKGGGLSLVTEANTHGEDCGAAGLQMAIKDANDQKFPVIGIGAPSASGTAVAQAFAPYRLTVNGQRITIVAATQIFDPTTLQASWTATATQPGLAAAVDPKTLIATVQTLRKSTDTLVVYLNWGIDPSNATAQPSSCPVAAQGPLAAALVAAGADVVVGSGSHVQQGSGFLGQALVSYGLGNLAFYDSAPPETYSGSLVVTATGRHVDSFTWRPALISGGLPQPLSGADATTAVQRWTALRACTNLTAAPGPSTATLKTQTSVAAATAAPVPPGNTSTTTTAGGAATTSSAPGAPTTTGRGATTTTVSTKATTTTAKK